MVNIPRVPWVCYPLLCNYVARGAVFLAQVNGADGQKICEEWVGRAADGVEVHLGNLGEEARIEGYLTKNPPEKW